MKKQYQLLFYVVENYKDTILEAERYIWEHPEVGYTTEKSVYVMPYLDGQYSHPCGWI